MATAESLLRELVSRPSLNPGDSEEPAEIGEERVAVFLESFFADIGFATERLAFREGRDNLLARSPGPPPSRTLLVEGHMDTVGVANMTVPAFELTRRGDRLHGRGTCDTKGPIAAALAGFTPAVLERLADSGRAIHFLAACAEEKGCHGAAAAARDGVGADECVVLEPTDLQPVIAHKGPLWFRVDLFGRACHGSQPERGVNALGAAVETAAFLQALPLRVLEDPLLGTPTRNLGLLRGGEAANIVPDHAQLRFDLRTLPGEDPGGLEARLRGFLDGMVADGRVLRFELRSTACPAFRTATDSALARRLAAVSGRTPTGTSWYSDAGPLAATCGEIAVFGPGRIEQAHTGDEHIEGAALDAGAAAMEALYLDFLSG